MEVYFAEGKPSGSWRPVPLSEFIMRRTMLQTIRLWYWRRRYRPGRVVTQFIACDIRRDVEVVDVDLIDAGMILAKTRTWNVLYAAREIEPKPAFGPARMIPIKILWKWSGAAWGGPVPDSTDEGG